MRELHRLEDLNDYTLHARDGALGQLVDVYFDDRDWQVRYLVVRTGGWLLGRDVVLLPDMVDGVDHDARQIDIDLTRDQIRHAPPAESRLPVSRHYEQLLYRHYDWPPYWGDDELLGLGSAVPPHADDTPPAAPPEEPANAHLRSGAEVAGYRIGTIDGSFGEVKDLIVEVPGWRLRYFGVATGNWLTGREVLIACAWLESVDWAGSEIKTVLEREVIASAPAYQPDQIIGRDDEVALYKHYGRHFEARD